MNILRQSIELPLIDISIVTCNSSKSIDIFFDRLLKQNYPTRSINILLTDDLSTDRTLELCRICSESYANQFNSFRVFEKSSLGYNYGHNHNLDKGDADYFLVCNVDIELCNDAISEAVNTAILDDKDVASWECRQKPFEQSKYYNPVTLETYWSSHTCTLFRRSAIESIDGYEEKISLHGGDVELSYRLRDNGFRLKYCPSAVYWHYTDDKFKSSVSLGATLANSYIRLRYGSFRQIAIVPLMYLKLLRSLFHNESSQVSLSENIYKIPQEFLYFLNTRKKSNKLFPIDKWHYGLKREGESYSYPQQITASLPLVSVIIRTYKGRLSYLKESVTSVLNQTYSNIELIVVEDGSNDAKDYMEQIDNISKLKVIYREEAKRGRCHTGNMGLSLTTGKFIVFLDDDDLFFADHIEVLTNELLAHPEVSATYSIAWEVSTQLISLNPLIYTEVSYQTIYKQRFSRLLMLYHNYIPIQSILFDRKLYDRYGGFDESLENLEDWNLWTQYCSNDNFLLIEKTTSMYRVPSNSRAYNTRRKSIGSYRMEAIEKRKNLKLTVTAQEVFNFQQEIDDYNKSMNISYGSKLKSFLFKYKFLKNTFSYINSFIIIRFP